MNEIIGFISVSITIFVWGTWLIVSRKTSEKIKNPFLENFLITIGALFLNFLVFVGYYFYAGNFSFDWKYFLYPLIGGIAWSFALLFELNSVAKIGVGKALSISAPGGMIVSFLWGILYYKEFSTNLTYAILAIIIIIIGTIFVINSKDKKDNNKIVFSGVFFAILASLIWGGTYLIPLKELSRQIPIFYTLLPLSIGMLLGSFFIFLFKKGLSGLNFKVIKPGFPFIISGFMWGIGNFFAIIAVINLGIGKAYPMSELCGVVNALFAVYFLNEIKEKSKIKIFLFGTFVSFAGAIWLSFLKI